MRLIDADKLNEDAKSILNENGDDSLASSAMNLIIELIAKQPDADVEIVKQGKWEYDSKGYLKCSCCGKSCGTVQSAYCPNCGARMKKNIAETLCWDCKRLDCVWMKNLKPVPGWTAERHIKEFGGKELDTYCVKECPEFRR